MIVEIITKSVTDDKGKLLAAGGTSGAGVVARSPLEPQTLIDYILFWTPHLAVFAGLAVSCAILYKTYLEIRLAKAKLQENDE